MQFNGRITSRDANLCDRTHHDELYDSALPPTNLAQVGNYELHA